MIRSFTWVDGEQVPSTRTVDLIPERIPRPMPDPDPGPLGPRPGPGPDPSPLLRLDRARLVKQIEDQIGRKIFGAGDVLEGRAVAGSRAEALTDVLDAPAFDQPIPPPLPAELRINDAIVVETADGWYVYRFRTLEYVTPDEVEVLLPVPQVENAPPGSRYITLTSCSPMYAMTERIVAYGVFESFTARASGPPAALTDGAAA